MTMEGLAGECPTCLALVSSTYSPRLKEHKSDSSCWALSFSQPGSGLRLLPPACPVQGLSVSLWPVPGLCLCR